MTLSPFPPRRKKIAVSINSENPSLILYPLYGNTIIRFTAPDVGKKLDIFQKIEIAKGYRENGILSKWSTAQLQGTLVPKLTLGPFLTLSVRNEHKLKDWVFRIPAHMTRTTFPNLKLFSEIKIIKEVLFILKPLTVFKTMSGFPFSNIS